MLIKIMVELDADVLEDSRDEIEGKLAEAVEGKLPDSLRLSCSGGRIVYAMIRDIYPEHVNCNER